MILEKMNDDNGTTSTLDDRYSYDNYDNALGAGIFFFSCVVLSIMPPVDLRYFSHYQNDSSCDS